MAGGECKAIGSNADTAHMLGAGPEANRQPNLDGQSTEATSGSGSRNPCSLAV